MGRPGHGQVDAVSGDPVLAHRFGLVESQIRLVISSGKVFFSPFAWSILEAHRQYLVGMHCLQSKRYSSIDLRSRSATSMALSRPSRRAGRRTPRHRNGNSCPCSRSERVAKERPQLREGPAAFQMAVSVIDAFEVVDVDHDKREIPACAHLSAKLLFELFQQHPVVEQSGQFVGPCELDRFHEELGLFEAR